MKTGWCGNANSKPNIAAGDDHFHDECALVGVWGNPEAAKLCYLGLYALQHRGQEGAGIVSWDGDQMCGCKDMGLVADVFDEESLRGLVGSSAIGHTRYATCGSKDWQNLQPFVANLLEHSFAVAHNGNLVNSQELRAQLEHSGAIFSSTSDTEVILHLVARNNTGTNISAAIRKALTEVRGAYSLVFLCQDTLVAVRDPYGVRPLSLAKLDSGYMVASESVAFDLVGAKFERELLPGEIVEIMSNGEIRSSFVSEMRDSAFCIFEHVYFARPDSFLNGRNVYEVRKRLGAELAKECPSDVDLVIPVPDSGVPAALGYAEESKGRFEFGLVRNHYVGRTFIEPQQSIRDFGVRVKLNPNGEMLRGKRVAVVDDSIVRGTTCQKIIAMVRNAGASEVHFRVSSPPTVGPCYYGIDTPTRDELVANRFQHDQIREFIGADTLGYLSLEGMYRAVRGERKQYCDACFSNEYRLGTIPEASPDRGGDGSSSNV
ncbi:MAG: amidophosphoribosyltransferase, partial [Deltaproteobacteria bacterium]|nr:amidophosphoribosyltransferase [Deltaproteobacteria bacterium]